MVEYIYLCFTQLALYQGRREVCSPQIKILPMKVVPYPAYTLFKDLKGEMVGMEFQDEMVEMGPQDYQGRAGTGTEGHGEWERRTGRGTQK